MWEGGGRGKERVLKENKYVLVITIKFFQKVLLSLIFEFRITDINTTRVRQYSSVSLDN